MVLFVYVVAYTQQTSCTVVHQSQALNGGRAGIETGCCLISIRLLLQILGTQAHYHYRHYHNCSILAIASGCANRTDRIYEVYSQRGMHATTMFMRYRLPI